MPFLCSSFSEIPRASPTGVWVLPLRFAAFTLVLATAFGAAYAIGAATDDDAPAPVHQDHQDHQGTQP